jgi:hypothetical protein
MPSRVMTLRRDDVCRVCGTAVPAGTSAYWDADARTVTCLTCLHIAADASLVPQPAQHNSRSEPQIAAPEPRTELDRGHAGASAAREYRRRQANREARTRRRHPWIGGAMLALSTPPQHERAWASGARGEESVARSLERRTAGGPVVILHDRRMPAGHGHANIDHLAVAPRGVFVIDAKAIHGKVRVSTPLLGEAKLIVAGRARTKQLDGLDRQVAAVREALAEAGRGDVPVSGVLCFTKADLPLLGSTEIRGHRLHHCRGTARKLNRSGPLTPDAIASIARQLAIAFPSA